MREFTEKELERYDGTDGNPCYVAYQGNIYDVTESPLFIDGMHFEHIGGADLTDMLTDAPHGDDVLSEFQIVGILIK